MLILNKTDSRTRLSEEFTKEYNDEYPNVVAPSQVPRSQAVRNAANDGETLFASNAATETAERAREAFMDNAEELLERL